MTEAELEREKLREDSEARDIIHDVNSLKNKEEVEKTRWVWELLQNAKDTATDEGVDISFQIDDDQIIISHNGMPFETSHLIAILHKKSTKSLGGDDGTTGKYGTGFVTTHILSKKLTISGIHQNFNGQRKFQIEIDRSSVSLEETEALKQMKESIKGTFKEINDITSLPVEIFEKYNHSFTYGLTSSSKVYAERGLDELEKNVMFTLLINRGYHGRKRINSITILRNNNTKRYEISSQKSKIDGLNYLKFESGNGLLYRETDNLVFGIPVEETENSYKLKSLENQAVLFKEFPLIGTENFNLPLFIQHNNFRPTEPRDGIVTKREDENAEEFIPDSNRECLIEFKDEYLLFLNALITAKVQNIHLLALSGLPLESKNYTCIEWYTHFIQQPIRDFLIVQKLVKTVTGELVKISDAKFPVINFEDENSFYKVLKGILPDRVPDEESILFWNWVINQENLKWPDGISISLEQLLQNLPRLVNDENDIPYYSLNVIYKYLQSINSILGEIFPIYLNEKNEFKVRDAVKLYPSIDDEFKFVSKNLGRDLDIEFLNRELGDDVPGIAAFDLEQFYKALNNDVISKIQPETANKEQILAILHINTLFKTDRSTKRENWLELIKELLPSQFGDRKIISIDYDNYYQPAELWTAKYICYLIKCEVNMLQFSQVYFEDNLAIAYNWINRFLQYLIYAREDIKAFLNRYEIIPTQEQGIFKPYTEYYYKENNQSYFDEELKILAKEHCNYNPKEYLIANEITVTDFRTTDVNFITKHIDKLFEDEKIASKIVINGHLHNAFNIINTWFDKHHDASSYLKTFASKRDMLYVISLGEGFSKQIKTLKESGKSMEDIAELAKINLSASEMRELERVANELGTNELIKKAEEMIHLRDQRIRWKQIGGTAEKAFKEIFTNLDMEVELNNPDEGKDFEILLKSKNFSIEIKNVIEGKESVRMSILQGITAVKEKDSYALCVVTRPDDISEITLDYFKENAKFISNIGYQIGDKINNWNEGLRELSLNDEIRVYLDDKKESVYVNRNIWKNGGSFNEFTEHLKTFFEYEIN